VRTQKLALALAPIQKVNSELSVWVSGLMDTRKPKTMVKRQFSHALTIAFQIDSDDRKGDDITPEEMKAAILERVLDPEFLAEALEATMPPYDTYCHLCEDNKEHDCDL